MEKWRFSTPNIWVITPKNEGNVGSHGGCGVLSVDFFGVFNSPKLTESLVMQALCNNMRELTAGWPQFSPKNHEFQLKCFKFFMTYEATTIRNSASKRTPWVWRYLRIPKIKPKRPAFSAGMTGRLGDGFDLRFSEKKPTPSNKNAWKAVFYGGWRWKWDWDFHAACVFFSFFFFLSLSLSRYLSIFLSLYIHLELQRTSLF